VAQGVGPGFKSHWGGGGEAGRKKKKATLYTPGNWAGFPEETIKLCLQYKAQGRAIPDLKVKYSAETINLKGREGQGPYITGSAAMLLMSQ
jgi:hypothetical protein